ncbi:MAG: SDR family oxidoreductase [Bacteroidetes bacterium]|jgi:nucleoside-diphosphate-sugar epimerase|nr:SDR family oxidoreductase [Bacteroidota bacterium]
MSDSPILITGATGFLGGFLAGELIKSGRKTVLTVRPKGKETAFQRVGNLLRFLNIEAKHKPIVIPAEIDKPGLGLSEEHQRILRDIPEVLHCAADTSFAERKKQEVETTNLQGLRNVFDVVPNCERFLHMSSAYSAGKQVGLVKEEILYPPAFHNPYEQSKNEAEQLITELCSAKRTRLTILRPSITYGDSDTGKSLRFNALYFPVRTLLFLRNSLEKDILERSGKRAATLGVSLNENGIMHLPLRFPGNGWLNLVPINFLVKAVTAIMESGETGIFHIVNPKSDTIGQLAQYIEKHYAISGLDIADQAAHDSPLQILINSYMDVYYPYFCDKRRFSDYRTRKILEPLGIECPELTSAVFKRCMDFAEKASWGSKIRV